MIRGRFSSGACALEKNNPLFPEGYSLIQLSSSGLVVKPEHGAWREYHRDQLSSSGLVVKPEHDPRREYHRDQLSSLGFVVKSELETLNMPVEVSLVPWDCDPCFSFSPSSHFSAHLPCILMFTRARGDTRSGGKA